MSERYSHTFSFSWKPVLDTMGQYNKRKLGDLDEHGAKSALYIATEHGEVKAVECLLRNGCHVDHQCGHSGETALHAALRLG